MVVPPGTLFSPSSWTPFMFSSIQTRLPRSTASGMMVTLVSALDSGVVEPSVYMQEAVLIAN